MRARYGRVIGGGDAIALPFAEGHSYTGEQAVEISVHGSLASVQMLLDGCLASGARFAEPGEFTYRAFLNGRMDLSQAEGVRDLVEAKTEAQLRQAELHRSGALLDRAKAIRERLTSLIAAVEASVDFSEEVGELDRELAADILEMAIRDLQALAKTAECGRLVRQGIRVAIAGRPNAGKSSLLNAILGSERAIVTDIPGTTRDYVEEAVAHDGLLWVLTDTAGLRESEDRIEGMGIERTEAAMRRADCVWYLFDAAAGWNDEDDRLLGAIQGPVLVTASKADIALAIDRGIPISALTGEGFGALFDATRAQIGLEHREDELLANPRQGALFMRAAESCRSSLEATTQGAPDDLVAVGLYAAVQAIGDVTGESASDDLLDEIFRHFCIGK